MSIDDICDEMKAVYENLLNFLNNSEDDEENFQHLFFLLEDIKLHDNKHDLRIFLRMISKIHKNDFIF